jgi:hypothetical protein
LGTSLILTPKIQQAEAFDLGCKFNLFTSQSKRFGGSYKELKLEPSLPPNALYLLLGFVVFYPSNILIKSSLT